MTNSQDSTTITLDDFPLGFTFGTGTASYQVEGGAQEGGRGISIWDSFCWNTPGRVDDGSNGNVACNMYAMFREDIKAMKSMGFNAYRFSISWPRVLPCGRRGGGVNRQGIAFYNEVIDTCIANGIEPFVTLFHWDFPQCLEQEYKGFLTCDPHHTIMPDFVEFAELCFFEFGDRVKNWVTLNEPWTYSDHGYAGCFFPPSPPGQEEPQESLTFLGSSLGGSTATEFITTSRPRRTFTASFTNARSGSDDVPWYQPKNAYIVTKNLLLAHGAASKSYKTKFQVYQKGIIGITLVTHWFVPLDDSNAADIEAAQRGVDFMLGWLLDPIMIGQYPKSMLENAKENLKEASFTDEEVQLVKGSIDFMGLNYYTSLYASDNPNPTIRPGYLYDQHLITSSEKDGVPIGIPTGTWVHICPEGLYDLLEHVTTKRYAAGVTVPPIIITENGMGENQDVKLTAREASQDSLRVQYHQEHLESLHRALWEGMNITGYFAWSWCDNFEWRNGYTIKFGITYIDYVNNLDRCPKDSAVWFAQFLKKKRLLKVRKRFATLRDVKEENNKPDKRIKAMEE